MQVSMNEHVNHILVSDTLFPTASSPASFEFWFPIHCTRTIARSFFFSLSLSLLFHLFAVTVKYFSRSLSLFYFPDFSKVRIYVSAFLQLAHEARRIMLFRYTLTTFFSLFRFLRFFSRWNAYARTLYVAFSAFLSTENDLHHNLRPNIGGHTSRHNSRVPSENLNGREGEGGVFFFWEKEGYGGRTRGAFKSFVGGRERKGKRVRRGSENVIIITLTVVII